MTKILHVIPSLKFGGEERFLLDIYPFLSNKFEHVVCPFLHSGELYTQTINLENDKNNRFWLFVFQSKNIFVHSIKPVLLFFYYGYRASGILRREKPEIVVSYTVLGAIAVSIARFFNQKNRFYWYARVGNQMDHPSLLFKFFRYRLTYQPIKVFINSIFKAVFSRSDCIVAVNNFLIKKTAATLKINEKKFFFLPCCLPQKSNNLCQNENFFLSGDFLITIGRLEYQKGFDFLIKTFFLFSKKHVNVKLVIVGEGSQRKELEALIQYYHLADKVFLIGFVKNPEKLIQKALLCVVPSRTEGFCKVVIEAMAERSLVIASDCDFGPREIIADGVNGIIFKSEDSASFLAVLYKMMDMSAEAKATLKNNAYQRALTYRPQHVAALFNAKLERDSLNDMFV